MKSVPLPASRDICAGRAEHGFSLVEAIVALALLAMITGLLASSVRGMRFVQAAMERSERANSVLSTQTYLRSLLASVAPAGGALQGGPEPAFVGDNTTIALHSIHAPLGRMQGVYRVSLTLQQSSGRRPGYDLVVNQSLIRQDSDDASQPAGASRRSVLLSGIEAASFSYFGSQSENGDEQLWHTAWTAADRLPRLVRIVLRFPAGDPRRWGSIELPLQLATDTSARCSGRQPC